MRQVNSVLAASARPFAFLRIGVGCILVVQAFAYAPYLEGLLGASGLLQPELTNSFGLPLTPKVAWFDGLLSFLGLERLSSIKLVVFLHVVSSVLMLAGVSTRISCAGTWLTHLAMKTTGAPFSYGCMEFINIVLFAMMFMPIDRELSLVQNRKPYDPFVPFLGLWALRFNLVLVYVTSGIVKASGEQWRNGEAIWRALVRPYMASFDFTWLASYPRLALASAWAVLVIEIGYGVFIWPRKLRVVWAVLAIGMHCGIAMFMGLYSFAAIMSLLNIVLWIIPAQYSAITPSEVESTPETQSHYGLSVEALPHHRRLRIPSAALRSAVGCVENAGHELLPGGTGAGAEREGGPLRVRRPGEDEAGGQGGGDRGRA